MKAREIEDFAEILADAQINAASDWDVGFVSDLSAKYERWGKETFVSEAQLAQLDRINDA